MRYQTCSQIFNLFENHLNVFLAAKLNSECFELQTPTLPLTACVGKPGKKSVLVRFSGFQFSALQ